ncbi:MAG: PHP domain-containing protein [Phycisphaerales bacterium]|jgi:3',5'-nucleoside bisphosphate phosphatase|nr:PHP domain-containing protein [Phycisphaerales bacterium]
MTNFAALADLHTHSTASDGSVSPVKVIRAAARLGLGAISLTDHDTVSGIASARAEAANHPGLAFIPGIEMSGLHHGPGILHILGLGIDETNAEILATCKRLYAAREERNPKIMDQLNAAGIDVSYDDVLNDIPAPDDGGNKVVARLHIANTLIRRGFAKNITDAFDRLIGETGLAYIEKDYTPAREVIAAIHAAGGVASLAHPKLLKTRNLSQLRTQLTDYRDAGLDAIECFHSSHSPQQTRHYLDLARELGLETTGGSDYHGYAKPDVNLARPAICLSQLPRALRRFVSVTS